MSGRTEGGAVPPTSHHLRMPIESRQCQRSTLPPSGLPPISPSRGEIGQSLRFAIVAESAADITTRESLLDCAMGTGRKRKSSEKLRRGRRPSEGLAFVARAADGRTGRYWKIVNHNQKNSVGGPTGYKLIAHAAPVMLAQEGCYMTRRGGFATRHIWVTRYAPDERYASGEFPNQHAGGDGLPRYIAQNRSIENEDIVVWHTFGATHVCRPEDFPVMPVEYVGFSLKPNGFFAENPALDLPPDRNDASRDVRERGACCA